MPFVNVKDNLTRPLSMTPQNLVFSEQTTTTYYYSGKQDQHAHTNSPPHRAHRLNSAPLLQRTSSSKKWLLSQNAFPNAMAAMDGCC